MKSAPAVLEMVYFTAVVFQETHDVSASDYLFTIVFLKVKGKQGMKAIIVVFSQLSIECLCDTA